MPRGRSRSRRRGSSARVHDVGRGRVQNREAVAHGGPAPARRGDGEAEGFTAPLGPGPAVLGGDLFRSLPEEITFLRRSPGWSGVDFARRMGVSGHASHSAPPQPPPGSIEKRVARWWSSTFSLDRCPERLPASPPRHSSTPAAAPAAGSRGRPAGRGGGRLRLPRSSARGPPPDGRGGQSDPCTAPGFLASRERSRRAISRRGLAVMARGA